jgi:hypothetical protein
MKLTPVTLAHALDEVHRVGLMVGGARAKVWARELREIAAKLEEGSRWGPRNATWRLEAARLKLATVIAERAHKRLAALAGAKALAEELPALEGKAFDAEDRRAIAAVRRDLEAAVAEEIEQVRLAGGDGLDQKVFSGWPPTKERDFEKLMRRIGGYVPRTDAARESGPLVFDDVHLSRASQLIAGEAEPDGAAETNALRRWQECWG